MLVGGGYIVEDQFAGPATSITPLAELFHFHRKATLANRHRNAARDCRITVATSTACVLELRVD